MEPNDLRNSKPRRARDEAGGIVFLPRSIDKVRATLEGGHLGEYTIEGFTQMMLDQFGISVDDFTQAVRAAKTDDDVVAYVRAHAKPGGIEAWIDFATHREVYKGNRAEAIADHPWLAEHPEIVYSLDFLDYTEAHGL
jgi:hypothetical protein